MNILFNLSYRPQFGEDIMVNVVAPNGQVRSQRMSQKNEEIVSYLLKIDTEGLHHLDYYYTVERSGQTVRSEWTTQAHRLKLSLAGISQYTTNDLWIDMPHDTYLYTSAFTQCVNRREHVPVASATASAVLRFKVRAPQLRSGERLVLVGNEPALGSWDLSQAISMEEIAANEWVGDVNAEQIHVPSFEYKFVAVGDNGVLWETCANRKMTMPVVRLGEIHETEHDQAFFEIHNVHLAGTLIPVFSLRTKGSFGVGDFGDLRQMIDWVAYTGQRLLQILPINDTTVTKTWTDSYPYSCISIFALHPQYVDIRQLPPLRNDQRRAVYEALREELNAMKKIDYEMVNKAKDEYMHLIFEQEGRIVLTSAAFKEWFKAESHWLLPYAKYCTLRDKFGTTDFSQWKGNEKWNEDDRKDLANVRTKAYREASYYYFIQFILAQQMQGAHEYAREKHVILKGDIPIGVNRNSCDVWQEPRYFNLNGQTGAPPDGFSVNGQNWGFPTYNWDAMLEDGCQWWLRRFQNMQKYFDAYRIDHVLGFFRIWEIPESSVHGLLGQFQPSLGLTRIEIENYGLMFREDFFCRPYITDEVLEKVFGEDADKVAHTFLEPFQGPYYRMAKDYDTQRKIEAWYKAASAAAAADAATVPDATTVPDGSPSGTTAPSGSSAPAFSRPLEHIRDGLYALISDVLFLRDHKNKDTFHPRISVQYDFIYEQLSDAEKEAFNNLYNDYFYRRNTHFWYREAMKKLPKLIEATRMLVCAEDLGMVPDCVPWVINDLRILSLELQSMPKQPGLEFGRTDEYPYRSVCTIDSHDMPTLRMWWDEDEERASHYYHDVLHRRDEAPHPMPGWLARNIVQRNMQCPSMLCILSLQDWLGIDESVRLADADAERINIPANPKHYWRYRMHVNIEDLLQNHRFCDDIMDIITQSGR